MEETLDCWFKAVLTKGIQISDLLLKNKVEELAQKLGRPDFVAAEGWLSRWKLRYKRFKVQASPWREQQCRHGHDADEQTVVKITHADARHAVKVLQTLPQAGHQRCTQCCLSHVRR